MSRTLKFVLIFFGSGVTMFLIFYFYPARIFDVKLIGSLAESTEEVSLKQFLRIDKDFAIYLQSAGIEMKRKLAGWMILFIITIGLPAMIAFRLSLDKKESQN